MVKRRCHATGTLQCDFQRQTKYDPLVTRSADKNDRRINIINLTEKGRNLEEMTQPIVATTMKAALNGLNEEEIETARILLNKVFNNVKISLGD